MINGPIVLRAFASQQELLVGEDIEVCKPSIASGPNLAIAYFLVQLVR